MSINQDIQNAIEKNLSAEVAGSLKDFIHEAELNKTLLKDTKKELAEITELYRALENLNRNYNDVNTRNITVQVKEKDLETKEEILKIREEHAKQRVSEIRELVGTVFQSNRLGYNINVGYTEYDSQTGSSNNKNIDGSLEPQI